jgi:exopolyphosphatase/guanosine-5'-triphosphate,3'-diphosphate pyrophosphatase
LGAGDALTRERLGKKAIQRGVEAISRFVDEARRAGVGEVQIAATSAVRDAKNRLEFTEAVLLRTGIPVTVLSGREEARLIHLGVSRGYPLDESLACIVDIGGGSTEFIVADHHRTFFLKSVPLGSLRLYERFRSGESIDVPALDAHLHSILDPLTDALRAGDSLPGDATIATIIGTSGTWLGLAAIEAADRGVPFNRSHGTVLELERLEQLQARMLSMTIEERKRMPGMSARRSDIIVAGNAVAIAIMKGLGLQRAAICDRALREGIVVDFLQRNHDLVKAVGDQRLRRLDSARELAQRFHADSMHEHHVAQLALELYDSFSAPDAWDEADRDLLVAAAYVHDIGHSINRSAHHKHSAYLVRHAGLPGWRPRERELLAQMVRYHRKSIPKPAHGDFMALDPVSRRRVERLSALLRIADGLDARHLSRVVSCTFLQSTGIPVIELRAEGEIDAEIHAAQAKADLFARVYTHMPLFRAVRPMDERADGEVVGSLS